MPGPSQARRLPKWLRLFDALSNRRQKDPHPRLNLFIDSSAELTGLAYKLAQLIDVSSERYPNGGCSLGMLMFMVHFHIGEREFFYDGKINAL